MARALIVSDEESTARFVRSALEEAGHTVIVVASIPEASRRLRDEGIDIILADLHVPGCQNPSLMALWRQEFHDVRIVALSDSATVADFLALRMMGAEDVLQKPVDLQELLQAVKAALREEPLNQTGLPNFHSTAPVTSSDFSRHSPFSHPPNVEAAGPSKAA